MLTYYMKVTKREISRVAFQTKVAFRFIVHQKMVRYVSKHTLSKFAFMPGCFASITPPTAVLMELATCERSAVAGAGGESYT